MICMIPKINTNLNKESRIPFMLVLVGVRIVALTISSHAQTLIWEVRSISVGSVIPDYLGVWGKRIYVL